MSVVCNACTVYIYILDPYFFMCFYNLRWPAMPADSSATTPMRVYMLRVYTVVILVLARNLSKMKQMVDFLVLQ